MGIQFTGLASGLDTQSIISELMEVENLKVVEVEKEQTKLEWKKDIWSEMNTDLYSFYKEELYSFKSNGTYSSKTVTSSDETTITVSDTLGAPVGSHEIVVSSMAKGSYLAGDELGTDINGEVISQATTAGELLNFGAATEIKLHVKTSVGEISDTSNEITILSTDTIASITSKINALDADMTINFDSEFNRFFASSTKTGEAIQLSLDGSNDANGAELLAGLGFGADGTSGTLGETANFSYNGTELSSDTNEISVNGLSLTIRSDSGTSNIAVTTNTDEIYESVKSFLNKYNELTLSMTTMVDADSASDYDVLTDEEKSAMTDDEIETWEDTIKASLLRNDDSMTNILFDMRNTLTLSSGVDTTDMSYNYLSDIGIVTGSYTEKGLLHIEGDSDDSIYSDKDNRLREAIEDNPEELMEFLAAIGTSLYEKMSDRMRSNSLSSALTLYNDKYMDSQVDDYDDRISDLQDQLDEVEARYYTQFTAMEQAIQQSNSTGDWLASQLANM